MKKIILLIAFFVLFAGCQQQTTPPNHETPPGIETPEEQTYEISFNSDGGTTISSQSVKPNATAKKPQDPVKDGYTFVGWFYQEKEFDFSTEITQNITLDAHWEFITYGMPVIEIKLSSTSVNEDEYYTSMEEVGAYIYTFHKLPSNFKTKSEFNKNDYTPENKLSTGGDQFFNREGLLPTKKGRTFTECDIDYTGSSRGMKRIVYSSDFIIFYTSTHYSSFSILRFYA